MSADLDTEIAAALAQLDAFVGEQAVEWIDYLISLKIQKAREVENTDRRKKIAELRESLLAGISPENRMGEINWFVQK